MHVFLYVCKQRSSNLEEDIRSDVCAPVEIYDLIEYETTRRTITYEVKINNGPFYSHVVKIARKILMN